MAKNEKSNQNNRRKTVAGPSLVATPEQHQEWRNDGLYEAVVADTEGRVVFWLRKENGLTANPLALIPSVSTTALHKASEGGNAAIIHLLCESLECKRASCSAGEGIIPKNLHTLPGFHRPHDGVTPLHTAVLAGNLATVKLLVEEYGVPIDVKSKDGNTPLHLARQGSKDAIADYLMQRASLNYESYYYQNYKEYHKPARPSSSPAHSERDASMALLIKNALTAEGLQKPATATTKLGASPGSRLIVREMAEKAIEAEKADPNRQSQSQLQSQPWGPASASGRSQYGHISKLKAVFEKNDVNPNTIAQRGVTFYVTEANSGKEKKREPLVNSDRPRPPLTWQLRAFWEERKTAHQSSKSGSPAP